MGSCWGQGSVQAISVLLNHVFYGNKLFVLTAIVGSGLDPLLPVKENLNSTVNKDIIHQVATTLWQTFGGRAMNGGHGHTNVL